MTSSNFSKSVSLNVRGKHRLANEQLLQEWLRLLRRDVGGERLAFIKTMILMWLELKRAYTSIL